MSAITFKPVVDLFRLVAPLNKSRFTADEMEAFNAHGWHCHYCRSKSNLSSDHIIPQSHGGGHHAANIVPACRSCNSARGNKPYADYIEFRAAEVAAFEASYLGWECI